MIPNKIKVDEFLRESNAIEDVFGEEAFRDAKDAWGYLIKRKTMNQKVVKTVHKMLMWNQKLLPSELGHYRTVDVWVGGRIGKPPGLLSPLILEWCWEVNNTDTWKEGHVKYEKIHPFIDGNGRTGRLFMNWQRIHVGLPILVIKNVEKNDYYAWFAQREETIVKAAIKRNGKVYTGFRHALILDSMRIDGVVVTVENPLKMEEQGFVTNTDRFVNRIEAANIAFNAGQIKAGINSLDSYQIFKEAK